MPNLTHTDTCRIYSGHPVGYQAAAVQSHWAETGLTLNTWAWVTTTCGNNCLNAEHMVVNEPRKLGYAAGQCIYCGRSAATQDHLLPRAWSGESSRAYVVVVPACGTCNSAIGDTMAWSITERRMICHYRLRSKYRSVLASVEYGPTDLASFDGLLRKDVEKGIENKAEVQRMLDWPSHDLAYDMRACERAGIEDPYASGILCGREEAARAAREAVGLYDEGEEGEKLGPSVIGYRSHGNVTAYRLGCRCRECCDAKAASKKRRPNRMKVWDG